MKHEQLEPNSNLPARRPRHDGWTVERQEAFLKALACCGCITDAAAAVGMSRQSAHNLYNHPRAEGFRRAFDAALDSAIPLRVEAGAWERAVKGVPRPIFYKGEQIGEYRHFDERLTMFLLRYRRPHRYGAHLDRFQPPLPVHPPGWEDDGIDPDEAIHSLDFHLEDLVDEAELDAAVDLSAFARPPCDGVNFVNFVGNEDGLDPPEFSREDAKNAKKR
jgi:hypothetical protein